MVAAAEEAAGGEATLQRGAKRGAGWRQWQQVALKICSSCLGLPAGLLYYWEQEIEAALLAWRATAGATCVQAGQFFRGMEEGWQAASGLTLGQQGSLRLTEGDYWAQMDGGGRRVACWLACLLAGRGERMNTSQQGSRVVSPMAHGVLDGSEQPGSKVTLVTLLVTYIQSPEGRP